KIKCASAIESKPFSVGRPIELAAFCIDAGAVEFVLRSALRGHREQSEVGILSPRKRDGVSVRRPTRAPVAPFFCELSLAIGANLLYVDSGSCSIASPARKRDAFAVRRK